MSEAASPIRLHLGCGEIYLEGYVNVDFPPAEHTVQSRDVADLHADLTTLSYERGTVAEVRLHHVFEHFPRDTALRLLIDWYAWLADDGKLVIETPDFERCCKEFLKRRKRSQQALLLRHIFGSQEAPWAIHRDGWYEEKYRRVLGSLGFDRLEVERSSWRGTFNITVSAYKRAPTRTYEEQRVAVEAILSEALVDDSESEQRLLRVWLDEFRTI